MSSKIIVKSFIFDDKYEELTAIYFKDRIKYSFDIGGEKLYELLKDAGYISGYDFDYALVSFYAPICVNGNAKKASTKMEFVRFIEENIGKEEIEKLIEKHIKNNDSKKTPTWRDQLRDWFFRHPLF